MKVLLSLLIILQFAACIEQGKNARRSKKSSPGETTPDNEVESPDFSTSSLFWFSQNIEIPGTITINENTQSVIHLRGDGLHQFLNTNNNYLRQFCLVASFNISDASAKKHFRARAVPIKIIDTQTNTSERILRIDLPDEASNQSHCPGTAPFINAGNIPGASITSVNAAYKISDICTNCSGIFASTYVSLFETNGGISSLSQIPLSSLDTSSLIFRFDTKSVTTNPGASCTNSTCVAKGFDCCIEGQCVNNGAQRPNASSDVNFAQALADVAQNPNHFINWPQIYYVCTNTPTPTPDPTPDPNPDEEAQAQFEALKAKFYCLEEGKKETPDFAGAGVCPPTQDQTSFESIRSEVWQFCGCDANPFPTDPDDPRCPNFGLKAITDESQTIVQIVCDIPDDDQSTSQPFQNLTVNVPYRSAPHRFFDSLTGEARDDIEALTSLNPLPGPEGVEFSYLDDVNKTDPQNDNFNMNAITGQFSLSLNQAFPAKVVDVEFDQTYNIFATDGFYTPCPLCEKDSWFETFTSHPANPLGNGLVASGYTTARNQFGNNFTNGNYEDNIFGRACWVPPTMLPFSHMAKSNIQTQRGDRLTTQAAYYINGYQRDWFGFNKGALIGSFDGITWFAIGSGRRVTTTSSKLYLAINAPFSDLTANTNLSVYITVDSGNSAISDYDHDLDLELNDPRQNKAATCQRFHQCDVDADCVTQLGWEYTCADITQFKTKWPKFDINGVESPNDELSNANLASLIQGSFQTGNNKRCVYRGAGAPCKVNYTSDLITADSRELLQCAPNFYCASLGSNEFNSQLARVPKIIDSILYGQETNILGRPLNYIAASEALPSQAISNIQHNAALYSTSTGDFGLCRPGKRLDNDSWLTQQTSRDLSGRTDYISQISSCDSSAQGNNRVRSCPIFETRDSQTIKKGDYIYDNLEIDFRHQQNACGGEAKKENPTGSGIFTSIFNNIEAGTLTSIAGIQAPSLAQDACFRRAGSICHTNLDCLPNELHAEQSELFDLSNFGGTQAEALYWKENLICAQAQDRPNPGDDDFFQFDMTQNLCCRAIGNDLTMFTQGDTTIIPDLGTHNTTLDTSPSKLSYVDPGASGRYSRYSIVKLEDHANGAEASPYPQSPKISAGTNPKVYQWKTINDTGKGTCCGGGWIRKFSDGTHDWTKRDRLRFTLSNFSCLNYKSKLPFEKHAQVEQNNYDKDVGRLCLSPADDGCIQVPILEASNFEVRNPTNDAAPFTAVMDTSPTQDPASNVLQQALNTDIPFMPAPIKNPVPMLTSLGPFNFMSDNFFQHAVSFTLPSYIGGAANITQVRIRYFTTGGNLEGVTTLGAAIACPFGGVAPGWSNPQTDLGNNQWCVALTDPNSTPNTETIHIKGDSGAFGGTWTYAGIEITFNKQNTPAFIPAPAAANAPMNPGNILYYLTKLSRFELSGIPQIFYEPLYCNNDKEILVEGLFNLTAQNRTTFDANSFAYDTAVNATALERIYDATNSTPDDANPTARVVYQDKLSSNVSNVFSGHEFMCCRELGQETSSSAQCCSNHSILEGDKRICKLPRGTNLNVYFNKFVSSEGMDPDDASALQDEDFVPETGEPKLSQSTYNKLQTLGQSHCDSGEVRKGSAFGFFFGQPNSGFFQQVGPIEDSRVFSIVDSLDDYDVDNDTGAIRFLEGFRWDHHFYCL